MEDVSDKTGENINRYPKSIVLNEVRFNGKDGRFVYVNMIDRKKGEKSTKEDLGESVDVIFLKIRRRIVGYVKRLEMYYTSTEHNVKTDNVYLFGAQEKGTADALHGKYKDVMWAERVVYAFLLRAGHEKELVRVIIKGSTLNNKREGKVEGTVDFFDYIANKKSKGEHSYMFVTKLSALKESGPLGSYFTINFVRGQKLDDVKLSVVVDKINELHAMTSEQDEYYKDGTAEAPKEDLPSIDYSKEPMAPADYPEDKIDPADIPF
jgi:hypothetical protein